MLGCKRNPAETQTLVLQDFAITLDSRQLEHSREIKKGLSYHEFQLWRVNYVANDLKGKKAFTSITQEVRDSIHFEYAGSSRYGWFKHGVSSY